MLSKIATAATLAACLVVGPAFAAPAAPAPEKKLDLNLQAAQLQLAFSDFLAGSGFDYSVNGTGLVD